MERRSFLRALLTGTIGLIAGAELDLDRLLWVPGAKTIFLPPVADVSQAAQGFLTTSWVNVEMLKILKNTIRISGQLNREYVGA